MYFLISNLSLLGEKPVKHMIGPSISSGRSVPLLKGAAVVVCLEERAASDSGVSCLRRMSTISAPSRYSRSPVLSTLLDTSFVFRSTAVTLVSSPSNLISIMLFPSGICLMRASIHQTKMQGTEHHQSPGTSSCSSQHHPMQHRQIGERKDEGRGKQHHSKGGRANHHSTSIYLLHLCLTMFKFCYIISFHFTPCCTRGTAALQGSGGRQHHSTERR